MQRHVRTEAGDTLIEVLLTVVILGLLVTALLGGLATLWSSSAVHRKQADATAILVSAAERVKSRDVLYVACAAGNPSPGTNGAIDPAAPPANLQTYIQAAQGVPTPGWTVVISNVTYEKTTSSGGSFDDVSCHNLDGLVGQYITVQATSADGKIQQRLSFVKGDS
jgi:type II secretory pathway pseudopilin PulG